MGGPIRLIEDREPEDWGGEHPIEVARRALYAAATLELPVLGGSSEQRCPVATRSPEVHLMARPAMVSTPTLGTDAEGEGGPAK
jgi:hypothetical protein